MFRTTGPWVPAVLWGQGLRPDLGDALLSLVNTLDTLFSLVRDLDYETLSRSGIVSEEELEKWGGVKEIIWWHVSCHFRETGAGPRGDRSRYIETDVGTVQSKYRLELTIISSIIILGVWELQFQLDLIQDQLGMCRYWLTHHCTAFQIYGFWSLGESWSKCSKENKAAEASSSPTQGRAYLVQLHSEPEL